MDGNAKKDEAIIPSPQSADATAAPQINEPVAQPRRVIRTFASDMAALNGAPPPEAKPIPQEQIHTPSTKPTLAESVAQIPAEPVAPAPLSNEPARVPIPSKPIVSEQTMTAASGFFSGLFKKKDLGVRVTTLSSTSPSAWASAPSVPRPAPVVSEMPSAPAASNEREEVLARLRTKATTTEAAVPVLPPVFTAPRPEMAPVPPQPVWTPPPSAAPVPPAVPVGDDRLRTYSADFSTRVDNQQASAFSVLAAQADSTPTSAPVVQVQQKSGGHGLAFALAGTVLIVGGSLALYYAYTYMGSTAPVPIIADAPDTLVAGDDSFALSGSGPQLVDALAARAEEPLTIGTVRVAYLETSTTTAVGVTTISEPGGALLKAMALPAPDILLRNIGSESTVGIISAGDETRPFFVLGARSYERTFAGMLAWEATMGKDLAAFYPAHPIIMPPATVVATTTATSTTPVASSTPPAPVFKAGFSDAVVESYDVRVLRDENGRTLLIYGYRDPRTLIIARDETAFSLLLARISATGAD